MTGPELQEAVDDKKAEQEELKIEIEKMTEIIVELRENCGKLQQQLMTVTSESPRLNCITLLIIS